MTLLISAVTKNHALLASDRRLSYINSFGNVAPFNDDSCKLIYYNGSLLFAYTGPAFLGEKGLSTDIWIARTLQHPEKDGDVVEAIKHLALKVKERISIYPNNNIRFFTIIYVGWVFFKDINALKPVFGHISTYIDEKLNRVNLKETNGRALVYWSLRPIEENDLPFVFTAGQNVDDIRIINLKRTLRKYTKNNVSQGLFLDSLYNEIIFASENNKGKDWIGKGVLSAAISEESRLQDFSAMLHGNSGTGQQFRYYPVNNNKHIFKAPHAVQPGGTLLTNIRGGSLEASNTHYVEASFHLPKQTWHIPWTHVHTYLGPRFDYTTWWCSRPLPRGVS